MAIFKKFFRGEISFRELIKHDFKINWFKEIKWNKKAFLQAFLFFIIPNILVLTFTLSFNLARPAINADYFIASFLFLFQKRFLNILGIIFMMLAIFVDALMIIMQIFPFANLQALLYLSKFATAAPLRYQIAGIAISAYLLIFPFIYLKSRKLFDIKNKEAFIVLGILVFYFNFFAYHFFYRQVDVQFFGHHNYHLLHSQYHLYRDNQGTGFLKALNSKPELKLQSENQDYASKRLIRDEKALPQSKKILFIVAESWGQAWDEKLTEEVLKNIYKQKDNFEFLEQSYFDFYGATVKGELRELCQLTIENGDFAFSKMENTEIFANCLPNKLAQNNYQTIAMHGAGKLFYDRYFWYPKAGFKKTYFSEDLLNEKRCTPFKGVCDGELIKIVKQEFAQNSQLFFYWLTLTTHSEWNQNDLERPRLDCKKYELPTGDICNSFRLHTQFFDQLADLIAQPEMKGAEVIVVGDHMPPVVTTEPVYKIRWQDVAFLHFKIKE